MISKERFSQPEQTRGLENLSLEDKLHRLYDLYCATGGEQYLGDLIYNAERLAFGIAFNRLRGNSHFRWGDFMDYLQEISILLMNKLRREYLQNKRQENIVHTIRSFYYLRGKDIGIALAKKYNGLDIRSFEALNEDADGNPRETLGEEDEQFNEELELAREKAELSRTLIKMFVENMMGSSQTPPRLMALCYCRILYQLEMRYDRAQMEAAAEKIIRRDTRTTVSDYRKMMDAYEAVQNPRKKSSPSWALERMGSRNFRELKQDSERAIQDILEPGLRWQKPFLQNMQKKSGCDRRVPWMDIVYTEHYGAKQTSALANDAYEKLVVELMDRIEADEELDREVQRLDLSFGKIPERGMQYEAYDER